MLGRRLCKGKRVLEVISQDRGRVKGRVKGVRERISVRKQVM